MAKKPRVRTRAKSGGSQAKKNFKKTCEVLNKAQLGRPIDYDPIILQYVTDLCLLGVTDVQLARMLKISEALLYEWKQTYPDFVEAIRKGKEGADAEIAKALYHRAKGYTHEAEEIKVVALGDGQGSEVQRVAVMKHYPPDTEAGKFWLKNRQPELWRDKTEVESKNETTVVNVNVKDDE